MRHAIVLTVLAVSLCAFAAAPASHAPVDKAPEGFRTRSVSSWYGGASVNIGIGDENHQYVGNPNTLNRRDRVMFSFDIRRYLYAGRVEKALLVYVSNPMGCLDTNEFELELFNSGRAALRKEDLISGDVTPLCQYEFSKTSQRQATLDVTEQLNAALAVGEGALTFRLRNITIETLGNRFSSAEGVSVPRQSVKLYIIPRRD